MGTTHHVNMIGFPPACLTVSSPEARNCVSSSESMFGVVYLRDMESSECSGHGNRGQCSSMCSNGLLAGSHMPDSHNGGEIMIWACVLYVLFCIDTKSLVSLDGLELTIKLRMTLNV